VRLCGGLFFFFAGSLWLFIIVHLRPVSGSRASFVALGAMVVFLAIGILVLRLGLSCMLGEGGVTFYCSQQKMLSWRRNWYLGKRCQAYDLRDFAQLRISATSKKGIFATHSGFSVLLLRKSELSVPPGNNVGFEVEFFSSKRNAIKLAERLATACHLPLNPAGNDLSNAY
jgi:hypothetical protein